MLRPCTLLEISYFITLEQYANKTVHYYFWLGKTSTYSQVRFPAIQFSHLLQYNTTHIYSGITPSNTVVFTLQLGCCSSHIYNNTIHIYHSTTHIYSTFSLFIISTAVIPTQQKEYSYIYTNATSSKTGLFTSSWVFLTSTIIQLHLLQHFPYQQQLFADPYWSIVHVLHQQANNRISSKYSKITIFLTCSLYQYYVCWWPAHN